MCVIDIQVDFAAPDGLMASFGVDMTSVPAAVEKSGALVEGARAAGVPVVFIGLQTTAEADSTVWTQRLRRREGNPELESAVCRAGTRGADFFGPQPGPAEPVVYKRKYSGFYETSLEDILSGLDVDTLVVCGLTTECCVDSTVRDAFHRDFNVFVVADATAAYGSALHDSSLETLDLNFAMLTTTADTLSAWQSQSDQALSTQQVTHV